MSRPTSGPIDRVGGALLLVLGVLALGTSIYLVFLRPPMLPEDLRFTGAVPQSLTPRMAEWLHVVFRTWGSFVAGFGLLLIAIGVHLLTGREEALRRGAAAAIVIAFGTFLASNVRLASDFLPVIAAEALLALLTAGWLILPRRQ